MILRCLIVLTLIFGTLQADDHKHHKDYHHYFSKDLTYLHLSKKQEHEMKKVLKEYRHQAKKFRKSREKMSDKKERLFLNDTFDAHKLKAINQELWNQAFEVEVEFLKHVHDILTPTQRAAFAKYSDAWNVE
ncbi:Spy/CpxP family protein refolding chaperone [Sulfurospirillum sp. 1612]|uniref:Spy/CpxP family protein refolding chaperone n=1 Tax=Sulfurospirillum sp. 1612 TaxID=3094835 RepID=UPI002F9208C9